MTYGFLWSLVGAIVVAGGSPWVLRPPGADVADLADRFVGSMVATGVAAVGALAMVSGFARSSAGLPVVVDAVFWLGAAVGIYAYVAGRQPVFTTWLDRLAPALPWVLSGLGTYLGLCWIRTTCGTFGGAPNPGAGGELIAGLVLIALGLVLHRLWLIRSAVRVAIAAAAIVAWRIVLADWGDLVVERPVTLAVLLLLVGALIVGWVRRRPQGSWLAGRDPMIPGDAWPKRVAIAHPGPDRRSIP